MRVLWRLTLTTYVAVSAGCAELAENEFSAPELETHAGAIAADPEAGYRFMANGNYIGCGIPVTVMQRALAVTRFVPEGIVRTLFPLAAAEVFTDPGVPGREGTNANLAPSFNAFVTKRGVEAINFNCMSCHAESINGQVIVGLGNTTRDFTQDVRAATNLLPAFAYTAAEREELSRFREAMDAIAPYMQTKTIGTNPAINLTYALLARRDAYTFDRTDTEQLAPPSKRFPPVDVPPWWRMSKKRTMFYNGEFAQNHHRIIALASILCIDNADEMRAFEGSFRDLEAWLNQLEAPAFPGRIDAELAAEGQLVFENRCARCHGTYGDDEHYEERIIPIEAIGTDPGLMEQQTGVASQRFREWGGVGFQTLYGEDIFVDPQRGYLAPPLDGVWATAPYLHNGSVPTMEGVLDSFKRPRYWTRDYSTDRYDVDTMSQPHRALAFGQRWALPGAKRYVYDTTLENHSNAGHTYGDSLRETERGAVLEYLKTL